MVVEHLTRTSNCDYTHRSAAYCRGKHWAVSLDILPTTTLRRRTRNTLLLAPVSTSYASDSGVKLSVKSCSPVPTVLVLYHIAETYQFAVLLKQCVY